MAKVNGGIAQLGEHLLCKQGVNGSIPFISTIRAHSSAGSSARLIIVRSVVRVHLGPPFFLKMDASICWESECLDLVLETRAHLEN